MGRKNLMNIQQIEITMRNDVPMASSMQVAKHFGKQHNNVLRDIRELGKEAPKEWFTLNFEPINVSVELGHATRQDPAFMMTRDGFTMLAMGFTGKKAFQWKLEYIKAFNRMEKILALKLLASHGRVMRAIEDPGDETPEIRRQRRIKCLRGFLSQWARTDSIPLEAAETALCAYLQIGTLERDFDAKDFVKGLAFLQRAIGRLAGKGEPATDEQLRMLHNITEACGQFRYHRNFDVSSYLKEFYNINLPQSELLTNNDAEKLLNILTTVMHEVMRLTSAFVYLRKIAEEERACAG